MNILVTKANYLGDAVTFLPTLAALAEHLPESTITIVATEVGRQVFEGHTQKAAFFTVDRKRIHKWAASAVLLAAIAQLRSRRFACSLHSHDEPSFSYLLARCLRIPRRIGFASPVGRLNWLLSEKLPWDGGRNVVDLNFDLARWLLASPALTPQRVPVAYTAADSLIVRKRLLGMSVDPQSTFAVLHSGAKLPYREWGLRNFTALAQGLERRRRVPVLFVSEGPLDIETSRPVLTGLTIKQLACLLDLASVFIGNNSGPMHLAAAMGTSCVITQGPSAWSWNTYWQDRPHKLLMVSDLPCLPCERLSRIPGVCTNHETPNACMERITVERVEAAVLDVLSRPKPR